MANITAIQHFDVSEIADRWQQLHTHNFREREYEKGYSETRLVDHQEILDEILKIC